VRDTFDCVGKDGPTCDDVDDCLHCYATQALERAR
jgi:hypothetical protein